MISFTVRMRFDQAELDGIRANLEALTAASRQEPGCVSYIAHFIADDPNTVLIYEQYADDAALDHHRNTPHFQAARHRRPVPGHERTAPREPDRRRMKVVAGFTESFDSARIPAYYPG